MKPTIKNFSLQLTESEAEFLERMARANDRSRGAEMRRLLHKAMDAKARRAGNTFPTMGSTA